MIWPRTRSGADDSQRRGSMNFYTLRVRLRSIVWGVAILTAYLGVGLAWKMLLLTVYPPQDSTMLDELRRQMRPYSSLPIGYLLGSRFGRMTVALHTAGDAKAGSPTAVRAFDAVRSVADHPGPWADLASFIAASLEQKPGWLPSSGPLPVQTMVVMLDSQRWGRTTVALSPELPEARRRLREIAERSPDAAIAGDALIQLAELDETAWDFTDAAVCRLTARLLPAARGRVEAAVPGNPLSDGPSVGELAAAYALYLRAPAWERDGLRSSLALMAAGDGDRTLEASLGRGLITGEPIPPATAGVTVQVDGQPGRGVEVALLDPERLRTAVGGGMLSNLAPGGAGTESIMRAAQDMNPARSDDPLRPGALALISPTLAAQVIRLLPVSRAGADGVAYFRRSAVPAGVTLLVTRAPGEPDVTLAPDSSPTLPGHLRFVPRVEVRSTAVFADRPPVLRWTPYPGAARYRVAVALETPSETGWPSTALSPDWDRRVLWWRDGIRGASVRMDPAGFVGPPASLAANGLWVGDIYRVVVVAEDGAGRPIASSLGLQDHPEEFFRPSANWLALRGDGAQIPARPEAVSLPNRRRFFRTRRPEERAAVAVPTRQDPLEQILQMARALSPPTLTGGTTREADLTPVPIDSPAGVPLSSWPSVAGTGQGLPPLNSGFLQQLLQNAAAAAMLAPVRTGGTAAGTAPGR